MTSASEGASNKDLVDGYVAAVRRGDEWSFTGPDITFAAHGDLLDGLTAHLRADPRIVALPDDLKRRLFVEPVDVDEAEPVAVQEDPEKVVAAVLAMAGQAPTGPAWLLISQTDWHWMLTARHLEGHPDMPAELTDRADGVGDFQALIYPVALVRIPGAAWPYLWALWTENRVPVVLLTELVMAGESVYTFVADAEEG